MKNFMGFSLGKMVVLSALLAAAIAQDIADSHGREVELARQGAPSAQAVVMCLADGLDDRVRGWDAFAGPRRNVVFSATSAVSLSVASVDSEHNYVPLDAANLSGELSNHRARPQTRSETSVVLSDLLYLRHANIIHRP